MKTGDAVAALAAAAEARDSGEFREARRGYRAILSAEPDHREAWGGLVEIELIHSRFDEARRIVKKAMNVCGQDASLLYLLGKTEEQRANFAKAEPAYEAALALAPGRPDILLGLARAQLALGHRDAALAALKRTLALAPGLAEAHGVLGDLRIAEGKPDAALAALDQGIALDSSLASLHNSRGRALQALNRLGEAQQAFDEALSHAPRLGALHYNAGNNLWRLGEGERARAALERAVELSPELYSVHDLLGVVLEANKANQEAVRSYQRAIRLDPREPDAHRHLGRLLVELEKLDEAEVCFENVLRIDPDDLNGLEGLADIYREREQPDKAIPYYRRAAKQGSASAAHFLAAMSGDDTASAPRQYVEDLFDGYSEEFDAHLTNVLDYQTPQQLHELLTATVGPGSRFERGLDLGCGTGLAGVLIHPMVARLDGVDLSGDMLRHAEARRVYASLHRADLVEFLSSTEDRFDLFVATDVLIYIGDLEPLFAAVRARAAPGVYFALSVEHTERKGHHLQPSGRYAHSRAYVEQLATNHDFEVAGWRAVPLRREGEGWIDGVVFVLRDC